MKDDMQRSDPGPDVDLAAMTLPELRAMRTRLNRLIDAVVILDTYGFAPTTDIRGTETVISCGAIVERSTEAPVVFEDDAELVIEDPAPKPSIFCGERTVISHGRK